MRGRKSHRSALNLFLPVVLEAPGRNGAWYSTELTLTNAGSTPACVVLTYRAIDSIGAAGSGTVEVALPAGRQSVIPALIPYLREHGIPIPESGAQGGTLRVRFDGLSSRWAAGALARTTTPSGSGRAGVAYRAVDLSESHPVYYLIGLQETRADRSNIGLANPDETTSVTLRVGLYRGRDGKATVLPDITIPPGGWTQIDSALGRIGDEHGYARVERVSGGGQFVAYAVVNDNTTGDGSYVEGKAALFDPELDPILLDEGVLPVVTESVSTRTELSYLNLPGSAGALFTYRESLSGPPSQAVAATRRFSVGSQLLLPNVFDELRLFGTLEPGERHAGQLAIGPYCPGQPCGDATTLGIARVLTDAPGGRGRYGVFVPVVKRFAHSSRAAWVHGLRQDHGVRSNLGVANLDFNRKEALSLRVEVFDGETGARAGVLDLDPVPGMGWAQINGVLGRFGVVQGYVRVTSESTSAYAAFAVYGVINDGASPGEGTGDASFVPMTIEE